MNELSADNHIDTMLQATRPLPLWAAIVLLLLGLAFVGWIYSSERGRASRTKRVVLATLRLSLLALVVWMLGGWNWLRFTSERPELIVVLDHSTSMGTQDVEQGREAISRLDRGLDILSGVSGRQRRELSSQYQTRWIVAAEHSKPITASWTDPQGLREQVAADGAHSHLGDALGEVIERQVGTGTAAIVFLSDGINTSGRSLADAAQLARHAALPVFVVAIGRDVARPDLRVADVLVERDVYLGDQVVVELSVIATDIQQAVTTLRLRDKGNGRVLDESQVEWSATRNQQSVRLSFVPQQPGIMSLMVEASALEDESELDNNVQSFEVNVQDKVIRALLVFQTPSYEFRFLKNLLERSTEQSDQQSASFELSSVLQEADASYVQQDASAIRLVPSDQATLDNYDVFIFGPCDPSLISRSSQQAIYEAVTNDGAGCIFIQGQGAPALEWAGWPLAGLLPVEGGGTGLNPSPQTGTYRWSPTSIGQGSLPLQLEESPRQSLELWDRLPPLHSIGQVGGLKPGVQVLAEAIELSSGAAQPLLLSQFAGAGRAALQATDETYLWASFEGSDAVHQRYWGQMLRWLSRGKLRRDGTDAELLVEPTQARLGQPIRFQLTLSGETQQADSVELVLETTDRQQSTLKLNAIKPASKVYRIIEAELPPGNYRATYLGSGIEPLASEEFVVSAPPSEQANLRVDLPALKELAAQSRGKFYLERQAEQLFEELPPGRTMRLGSLPPKPIWNHAWVALLFVTILASEWWLRRTARML
ncbi:VWA domain-containing protein [Aureliella helgolandensis]|uniref:VWFA domain-containing protein n=1 Tax=Aureliella helgolandensis TaxID=2527968 RepID=A0A518GHL3_9BACT|nr:VWA domain-containing protein [Aureliella helgolandensis]QDV28083.1 hypothetical protein Q31a_64760 [Aureliella helgolandensis]